MSKTVPPPNSYNLLRIYEKHYCKGEPFQYRQKIATFYNRISNIVRKFL